jgi:lysophospholipase L1-like esterase
MVVAIGLATSSVVPTGTGHAAAPSLTRVAEGRFNPPKQYYLALGDSLAFGYQEVKFDFATYNPAQFNTGYVDDFFAMLQDIRPNIQVVNYGCPQETSTTLIVAPCPFLKYGLPLHETYSGSQLDAAVAFLKAHPGQVSPITLNIGANDFQNIFKGCSYNLTCAMAQLQTALATIGSNLDFALANLRSAAPNSEIIVLTQYNPYAWLIPETADAFVALNTVLASVVQSHGARVADGSSMVSGTIVSTCTMTLLCSPEQDFHPSDLGYQALADAVWAASGYGRLVD